MANSLLEKEIERKKLKGEERIVVSVSFRFTDPHEMSLLEHLWQFRKGPYLKRLIDRDIIGPVPAPVAQFGGTGIEEMETVEDVSSFL